MKYFTCMVKHDPPNTYGDCLRASVASILNRSFVHDVPHFLADGCDSETGFERLRNYCKSIGFLPWVQGLDGSISRDDVLNGIDKANPGIAFLLFGRTENDGDHVVICRDGKIIHNTAWNGEWIKKPTANGYWIIMVFVPIILADGDTDNGKV